MRIVCVFMSLMDAAGLNKAPLISFTFFCSFKAVIQKIKIPFIEGKSYKGNTQLLSRPRAF